jgi:hypothetical protein
MGVSMKIPQFSFQSFRGLGQLVRQRPKEQTRFFWDLHERALQQSPSEWAEVGLQPRANLCDQVFPAWYAMSAHRFLPFVFASFVCMAKNKNSYQPTR